ncbi:hypothetical protein ESA94_02845 [Lacibacter luteus]|uniref:DUF3575 domain-containing protein n=1 Tax=Lacibacter luteus TaxID=2508719 RepID=A0A4Q1CLR2_9BACT|nr:hypothetical protein [Lacibacter luteus]RXK61968.1 hypothetical protein ESA94_02845 [Lacibacter luteus]
MKKILLLLAAFIVHAELKAQKKSFSPLYQTQLHISPLGLLDVIEHNVSAGFDTKVANRLYAGADVSAYFWSSTYSKPLNGFAVRPMLRLYNKRLQTDYVELVLMYKRTALKEQGWLGMDCVNNVPSYEKFDTYKRIKEVYDISFRYGTRQPFFSSGKWFYECYFGIGIRHKQYTVKYNEANSCMLDNGEVTLNFFGNSTGNTGRSTFFSLPCGFRLVRTIK